MSLVRLRAPSFTVVSCSTPSLSAFLSPPLHLSHTGEICGVVSNLDPASNEFQESMDHLNRFMAEIALPRPKKLIVREFFHHCKGLFRAKFYHQLLERMSPKLQGDISMHVHGYANRRRVPSLCPACARWCCYCRSANHYVVTHTHARCRGWVSKIPFFMSDSPDETRMFISALAVKLVSLAYVPQELLIREGEFTNTMFIIQRGIVARLGRVLGAGRFVGEVS